MIQEGRVATPLEFVTCGEAPIVPLPTTDPNARLAPDFRFPKTSLTGTDGGLATPTVSRATRLFVVPFTVMAAAAAALPTAFNRVGRITVGVASPPSVL